MNITEQFIDSMLMEIHFTVLELTHLVNEAEYILCELDIMIINSEQLDEKNNIWSSYIEEY